MSHYTEEDVQNALFDIKNGLSQRKAASKYGIPRSTLFGRIQGGGPRKDANDDMQKLSKDQEDYLANWVVVQAKLGLPPTHLQIRQAAQRIINASGSTEKLGKNWVNEFARRNPSIKAHNGKTIDKERVEALSPEKFLEFFEILQQSPVREVRPANRWNMDETGIMEGITASQTVFAEAGAKKVYVKKQKRNKWTTIIECVSAEGNYLPPTIIWQGKSVQQQWFPEETVQLENWSFTASKNGYSNNNIGLEWLTDVFIPHTKTGRND